MEEARDLLIVATSLEVSGKLDSERFEVMLRSSEPYAVIALDERDFWPHSRHELSISLTLAFLLSARLRFHFLMSDDVLREVDRAFDQVLKDLPLDSKGIAYRKDLRRDGKLRLLDWAQLVITSDPQIQKRMDAESSPNIFLDFKSSLSPFIRWRFLENLEDDILKQRIIVYSKLINTALENSDGNNPFEKRFLKVERHRGGAAYRAVTLTD